MKIEAHSLENSWIGAAWKVAAFACYAGLNGIARYLSGGNNQFIQPLPVYEIVFFQDLFAFVMVLPWFFQTMLQWRFQHLPLHITRGILSGVAVIGWYFALFYLPLADAVAMSVVGPMLGVLIAKTVLKEKIKTLRLSLIILSFTLALIMMNTWSVLQTHQQNYKGLFFVLFSALCFALAKITTRMLAQRGTQAKCLTFTLLLFILPVSFIPALASWVPISGIHIGWLMLAGLLTVASIYCVSQALIYAEVTFLAPFDLSRFVFNAIVGYFAFTELPTMWALIAMALVFALVALQLKKHRASMMLFKN